MTHQARSVVVEFSVFSPFLFRGVDLELAGKRQIPQNAKKPSETGSKEPVSEGFFAF